MPFPSPLERGSLLALVVLAHVLLAFGLTRAPNLAKTSDAVPIQVEFLSPEAPRSVPVRTPQPTRPLIQPTANPKSASPTLETTSSTASTSTAPLAPLETRATPANAPTTPSEPAVSPPRFDADYLRNPAPNYPPLSRRAGEQGTVVLRVLVSPLGLAENVDIKSSSGSTRLDEAALKTVRQWKFVPARKGEIPIQSTVLVPIIFKLE